MYVVEGKNSQNKEMSITTVQTTKSSQVFFSNKLLGKHGKKRYGEREREPSKKTKQQTTYKNAI